ncbi:hypothetical protein, unknown function [Leishmania tarentolae]|uniref:Uncharacterized protein n=1 Tax=Leishmania tarentolae TaxID=5689 RepID=A0A640KA36_LEITA|nr:hypothetical protein, unknown function [Leishmania tarentolae]
MRDFFLFEGASLFLCWVALFCLTEGSITTMLLRNLAAWMQSVFGGPMMSSATVMQDRTAADVLPEERLSLFWMRRAMVQPYKSWYLHSSEAYSGVPVAMRLPKDVVAEGQILYPLHVLYLYGHGVWLQWVRPDLAMKLFTPLEVPRLTHSDLMELRNTLACVSVGCVILVGAPGAWCLARALSRLLRRAACDRERAACLHLPADVCATVTAPPKDAATASARWPDERIIDKEKALAGVAAGATRNVAAFLGAFITVVTGMLPLLVMEVCTMQPWCLCGSLLVWALFFAIQNELHLHADEAHMADSSFDVVTPILVRNSVEFLGLKQEPSIWPLVALSLTATVIALAMPSCLLVTLLFFLWNLSACWQRGYRRVCVRVMLPREVSTPSLGHDNYVRMGYSCYRDTFWVNRCFCCATLFSVCLVLTVTTPWWLHQQPVLTFMDLFASPPMPSPIAATKGEAAVHAMNPANLSFTGGHEMHVCCLAGPYSYYNCAQPAPNMWRLTEWLGLPWTALAKTLTWVFTVNERDIHEASPMWLNYSTITLLTLVNAGSILVLAFYRFRKPPLSFETPEAYAAQRVGGHDDARPPAPSAPQLKRMPASTAQGSVGGEHRREKVVTCLSREEYVVKQAVLLCWMLSASTISGTVLLLRNAPSSCVLVFPCGSLLGAAYVMICILRRERPLAFYPGPQQLEKAGGDACKMKKAAATPVASQGTQGHGFPAPMQKDDEHLRPSAASRWCTTAVAPSMAHAADVVYLYLVFAASVLGTGALTWATVPMLLRYGILLLLCGCAAVSLAQLRTWAQTDTTCYILVRLGSLTCFVLGLLLAAQAVPQSSASAAAHWLVRFTDKMGDVYTHTGDNTLRLLIYQCIASCFLYTSCVVHATLRVAQLALEPEETDLAPIEEERRLLRSDTNAAAVSTKHGKKQK